MHVINQFSLWRTHCAIPTLPTLILCLFSLLLMTSHHSAAAPITNAVPYAAKPLPLSAVRLTGGPLKRAQDVDAAYLLSLEPDRMMAYFRQQAGLAPKAKGYGGWDGDGKNL